PAVFLPRKEDAVAGCPVQLAVGHYGVEDTAGTVVGAPDLAAGAVGDRRDADGPRIAGATSAAASAAAGLGPHAGDLLAVGRPMELADVDAVVGGVAGDANAFEIGSGGHPDVAGAALIQEPRDLAAAGRGDQF